MKQPEFLLGGDGVRITLVAVAVSIPLWLAGCTGNVFDGVGSVEFAPSAASPLNPAFGTAHARPRYNPNGSIQTAFVDGARDAYDIGIQTLKIWIGPEIKDPSFYFLPPGDIANYTDFASALSFASFAAVLAVPFRTVVFEADDVTAWTMANTPLTQADKDRIYKMTYDFTARLRQDFAGSGRTFVIQNHEGDWHIDPTGVPNAINDPNATGLTNFSEYWRTRQRAVEDARAAVPSDVNVYHLCEVVRVLPSLQRDAPSLTRDVLPNVTCDLVGYSSYESALQSNDTFEQALAYVRSRARPSPSFGTNQVVVSEIGLPEQNPVFSTAAKQNLAALIVSLVERGVPYVLFWTLYDNECTLPACSQQGAITSNVPQEYLHGYYVRKPDRSFGFIFSQIMDGLAGNSQSPGSPSAPAADVTTTQSYLRALYATVLQREADASGLDFWTAKVTSGAIRCVALTREFLVSPEASALQSALSTPGFVAYLYPAAFGRAADPPGAAYWEQQLDSGAITRGQMVESFAVNPEVTTRCQNAGLVP